VSRRDKIALALAATTFALVVAAEVLAPQPVDWTPSYERDDTRPYAGRVLYDVLPQLFPAATLAPVDQPPYLVLRRMLARRVGHIDSTTYFFLTQRFAPDAAETEQLLDFARAGGTVFVGAQAFAGPLADSLHLETGAALSMSSQRDSTTLRFASPSLAGVDARFRPGIASGRFAAFDTARAVVLGTGADSAATFLRVEAGAGELYLSTTPRAFSNYALLNGGERYAYAALSHLPAATERLLWDGHAKPARSDASTPLRVVLSDPALRVAYILLVAAALLFAVFEGRRRQRAVPVVEPPANETAGFVRTVGQLYFERGDHANLAQKKITHFRTYARERLRLSLDALEDPATAERVAERSGAPPDDVRALLGTLAEAEGRERFSEDELQTLSRRLNAFYQNSQR
jgi:hypothetical protein